MVLHREVLLRSFGCVRVQGAGFAVTTDTLEGMATPATACAAGPLAAPAAEAVDDGLPPQAAKAHTAAASAALRTSRCMEGLLRMAGYWPPAQRGLARRTNTVSDGYRRP
jgi:hypothetical protein